MKNFVRIGYHETLGYFLYDIATLKIFDKNLTLEEAKRLSISKKFKLENISLKKCKDGIYTGFSEQIKWYIQNGRKGEVIKNNFQSREEAIKYIEVNNITKKEKQKLKLPLTSEENSCSCSCCLDDGGTIFYSKWRKKLFV